jgi:hypothetical protein
MCSPLGVRTSFAWRLPFERPFAAVREPELDDGMRISYANGPHQPADVALPWPSSAQPGGARLPGPAFWGQHDKIYNPRMGRVAMACVREPRDGSQRVGDIGTRTGEGELLPAKPLNRISP